MEWREIAVHIPRALEDQVSYIFYRHGAGGLDIVDPKDIEVLKQDREAWELIEEEDYPDDGTIVIKAYFPVDEALEKVVEGISADLSKTGEGYSPSFRTVRESDWSEAWKQFYKPVKIGKRIYICPSWETLEDPEGRLVIRMDPGMAFGTGTHETTRLCIEYLEKYLRAGDTVFDIGCGSGILSIVSAKLGAAAVTAVDIDEMAVKMSRENVQENQTSSIVSVHRGDLFQQIQGKARLIVSNIIAEIIVEMVAELKKYLLPDGIFITSGIIVSKREMVEKKLRDSGFDILETEEDGDWCVIVAKAPGER